MLFQAEDGIRAYKVTGVQTCALPIWQDLDGRRTRLDGAGGGDPGRQDLRDRAQPPHPGAREAVNDSGQPPSEPGGPGTRSEERRVGKRGTEGGRREARE